MVLSSPSVTVRLLSVFASARAAVVPSEPLTAREEDVLHRWTWIPFGAGRHRCVGAQFAMMQLKVILSVLLKDWTFELGQPAESYVNDHSKMVVQMSRPTTVKYRKREAPADGVPETGASQ